MRTFTSKGIPYDLQFLLDYGMPIDNPQSEITQELERQLEETHQELEEEIESQYNLLNDIEDELDTILEDIINRDGDAELNNILLEEIYTKINRLIKRF